MSERSIGVRVDGVSWRLWLLIGLLPACGGTVHADDLGGRHASWEPRVPVANYLSPDGNLLVNDRPGQPWRTVGERGEIRSRDLLLALPGMQARLATTSSGVELTLWGNLPELSDFSGLQSAVILHDSRAFDIDFTLHRGRVIVANRKEKGSARVWVRVEGSAFQLTLNEPGDAICLALYNFWPRGVPFNASPKADEVPVRSLTFLVVKGRVNVKADGTQHLLSAPPGPAFFHWDSVNGAEQGTRNRRVLPAWADLSSKAPPEAQTLLDAVDKYRAVVRDKEPRTALFDVLAAVAIQRDPQQRKALAEFAVFGLAAINDIDRVMQALADPRHAEPRQAAIIALRHWIADAAGRDARLDRYLVDRLRYSKVQAATMLQLLHSAFAAEEPDTYETLLAYLRHEKLAIRELAWWHLSRLVPQDIALPYDPAAPPTERAKAAAAWKELIPSGSLPTRKPKKK
jgi:hypothetical protein